MKVYIVTVGYVDRDIIAVMSTEEAAQAVCKTLNSSVKDRDFKNYDYEEWEVDK
jgi:hypothetical protein